MGIGRFKNGKFDLILSLRHNVGAARIEQWERSFRRASEILYDATDGQMQFGRLYVANQSAGNAEADAYLLLEEGISSSHPDQLGTSGMHMTLRGDERNKPYIVVHEFGHYGLALYDENKGPKGDAECTGDADSGACIMEFSASHGDQIDDSGALTPGTVSEFCTAGNHDPDGDTVQEAINSESCWETIVSKYPSVSAPAGAAEAAEPSGHEPVEWILLEERPRFSLVLDRSGSMAANDAINGIRFSAAYWINTLLHTGDSLSVIAYSSVQRLILSQTVITSGTGLSSVHAELSSLTASGQTNIGDAMELSADQIASPGGQAATQAMVLFSDGLHNDGPDPATVLPTLIARGIRAYTIGFGPGADQGQLQEIAEQTGGEFRQIDPLGSSFEAQLLIQDGLILLSGEIRDGTGAVTILPDQLPEPPSSDIGHWDARFAYVEEGSSRATFVLSHRTHDSLDLQLLRPDGSVAEPSDPDVSYVEPEVEPYVFYMVDDPAPGQWQMRVSGGLPGDEPPFSLFAFSDHRELSVAVGGIGSVLTAGEPLTIQASATYHVPLTGMRDPVLRLLPDPLGSEAGSPPRFIRLRERLVDPSAGTGERLRNGLYEGTLTLNEPGSYLAEVTFNNSGGATEASAEAERPDEGDPHVEIEPPPRFMRTKRFQVHVGPLPRGKELKGDVPKPPR